MLSGSGASANVISDTIVEHQTVDTTGAPDGPPPIESSAVEPTTRTSGLTASAVVEPALKVVPAQTYALDWTSPPYAGDDASDFNPDFPYFDNNCANFVSQVLHAGGWTYQQGLIPNNTAYWAPDLNGLAGPSRSWSASAYQYIFVDNNGYSWLDNIWNAKIGDLLYTDWDPNGQPDGEIDRVMFVAFGSEFDGDPVITQKTPNRFIPLSQSILNAQAQGRTVTWYGLKR